jgi:hypothetical protein
MLHKFLVSSALTLISLGSTLNAGERPRLPIERGRPIAPRSPVSRPQYPGEGIHAIPAPRQPIRRVVDPRAGFRPGDRDRVIPRRPDCYERCGGGGGVRPGDFYGKR